jgi:hypothetical protein
VPDTDQVDARTAVLAALEVLAGSDDPRRAQIGTAGTRQQLELLAAHDSAAELQRSGVSLPAVVADLFNWLDDPKATKAIVRTVGAALTAGDPNGRSAYAATVEMLSFAAACAPLVEPDRLARLVAKAPETESSYAPILWTGALADKLFGLLAHFQPARREALLVSLWETAHDGRWWDHTGGVKTRPRVRRRRRGGTADVGERGVAAEVEAAAASDTALKAMLLERRLPYSDAVADRVIRLRFTPDELDTLVAHLRLPDTDPDFAVLVSFVDGLGPSRRPPSPIMPLVDGLERALADNVPAEMFVAKPRTWSELYPDASLVRYPYPEKAVELLHNRSFGAGARVELIRNDHDLKQNANYMGNCTFAYAARCATGQQMVGRVFHGGALFNFSVGRSGHEWRLGEVNSRFNSGGVPDAVRSELARIVGELNQALNPAG